MATTTIWIPGASARASDLHDVFTSGVDSGIQRNALIEDTAIVFTVPGENKKVTFYIPVPTISILNDAQLYLKRFTVNLEFLENSTSPLTLHLYDGSDEVFTDANPIFTPTYEHIFKTAHKINKSLLIGLEFNIPLDRIGTIIKIKNASFDLQTPELITRNFVPIALALTAAALLLGRRSS